MKYSMWVKQEKESLLRIRHLLINSGFKTDSLNTVTGERKPIPDDYPIEKIFFLDDNIIFVSNYKGESPPNQEVLKKLQEGKEPLSVTIEINR